MIHNETRSIKRHYSLDSGCPSAQIDPKLFLPLQRVLKYPLLTSEILKQSSTLEMTYWQRANAAGKNACLAEGFGSSSHLS